jgi:DnaJ-class molecular chaperone
MNDCDDYYDDEDEYEDRTCSACSGTGGDPWNDGILPCEECDGEGYLWWL